MEEIKIASGFEPWFLEQISDLVAIESQILIDGLPETSEKMSNLKRLGFSDKRLAKLTNETEKQIHVGFALETHNEEASAKAKIKRKNLDLIVLNSLQDIGVGFGQDTNKVTIYDRFEKQFPFELKDKKEVAQDILKIMESYA